VLLDRVNAVKNRLLSVLDRTSAVELIVRRHTMRTLIGQVFSGRGDFAHWIAKLQEHYSRKTGMNLFPGTLNIQLDEPFTLPQPVLRLEASEYGGSVSVNIVPCRFFGRPAFILRTDANDQGRGDHPNTVVEIASDIKLRDAHSIQDGDKVSVEIDA
jgi:riboflavin kinase, archaea type